MGQKSFTYELKIDAEINDLIAKTNQVKKSMQSLMDSGKAPGADKIFISIEKAIDKLQTKASQPITSVSAFENLQKDAIAVGVSIDKLGSIIENLQKLSVADKIELLPPDLKKQVEDAQNALIAFSKSEAAAGQKTEELADAEKELISAQKELKKVEGRVQDRKALVAAQSAMVEETKAEANAIKAKIDALKKFQATNAAYEAAGGDKRMAGGNKAELAGLNLPADRKAAQSVAATVPGLDLKNAQSVQNALDQLGEEYKEIEKVVADAESTQRRYSGQLKDAEIAASTASTKVENLRTKVSQLNTEFDTNKAKNVQLAYNQLRTEAGKLGVDLSKIPIDYTEENLVELNAALNQLIADGIAKVDQGVNNLQAEFGETSTAAENFGNTMRGTGEEIKKLDETVSNTSAFAERIKQFVGLQGGIEIARSAMRNAITTIKDLDKAMTEMAVVTNLEVGDYWKQLPRHTEDANKLGVAIKDVYEAETLYYQQGLKTNEVIAMSNETLKMARIAGLSAEDATNKMTAALRGFNMELNETSAQKVADVYSELAAITASDVNEISSAMTKTASIAASAGMEFETTAAFLSQIIETTRESAETAGTALKTVIARFQELKKDPSEIGEIDGEIVDANKIETALRSVGVSLRDANGQFRELDDVFLELSSKWDGLDTNTQRYIATIAAGSRQQSRFIAMMSDYSRTQELVTAANSSAGASNKQFEKTMDSLESKLNKLKNAWDSFTMGIMDSDLLKAGIDLLTGILTAINNITDAFGDFNGAAKIGLLVTALYLGDKALKVFMGSLQGGSTIFGAFGKVGKTALTGIQAKLVSLNKIISMTFGDKGINVGFSKETIARSKKDLSAYTEATRKHASAKAMLNNLEEKGATDTALYSAIQQRAAEAEKERVAVEGNLMVALGLNEAQMAATTAMTAMGVSADKAAILAKAGISAQNLAAAISYSGLSAAQVGAQLAAKLENASAIRVLSTKIALTIANWAQAASNKAQEGSLWGSVTATIAQTMANWGLQASMWPILVVGLLIIAALATLIGLIVTIIALIKRFNANSPEEKLKSAEEATDAAAKAAERTAEAYNNLVDAVDSLSDKYSALEELTAGTREWRDAIKEINDEVLTLIDEYPELAKFVQREDGVLKLDIESDEVQNVLDTYENKAIMAKSAELASQISVMRAQETVQYSNLKGSTRRKSKRKIDSGADDEKRQVEMRQDTDVMAQALAQNLIFQEESGKWKVTEGSEEAFQALGLTAESAINLADSLGESVHSLKEYGEEIEKRKVQEEALYEAMAQNALLMVDTSDMREEEAKLIKNAASGDFVQGLERKALDNINNTVKGMSNKDKKAWYKNEAIKLYGTDEIKTDNQGNLTIGSGDEEYKVSAEEFKKQLASTKATEASEEALKTFPQTLKKAGNILEEKSAGAAKALSRSYTERDGGALTQADLQALKSATDGPTAALGISQKIWDVWDQLSEQERNSFGDVIAFNEHIQNTIDSTEKAFDNSTKTLSQMGISVELSKELTASAVKGYADQLEIISQAGGQASVDAIQSALNDATKDLAPEDYNKVISQLNSIDWTDLDAWDKFPDTLQELGLVLPETELQNFIKTASEAAGAIREIDLESLEQQLLGLQNLQNKIQTKQQGRVFSGEDYETLTKMDSSLIGQFTQNLEGEYIYLGSSMDKLTQAIINNTSALLKQATEQLQNKIDAGQLMDWMSKNAAWGDGSVADIANYKKWDANEDEANTRGYLTSFIEWAKNDGIDLKQLNIDGLTNQTEVSGLTDTQIDDIMAGLYGVYGGLETNQKILQEQIVNSRALTLQNENAVLNSTNASIYRQKKAQGKALSEEEEVELQASTRAIWAQAQTAGVNDFDVTEYAKSLEDLSVIEQQYKEGKLDAQDYQRALKKAEALEQKVVNKTNLNNMNANLVSTFETISDLGEKLKETTDLDTKIETVAQMVSNFGIAVDESNYEKISELALTMAQGGEEGYKAFQKLALEAGKAYDIDSLDEIENMNQLAASKMSESAKAFAENMIASGLALWEEIDGELQFVWNTENRLTDASKAAGIENTKGETSYDWLFILNQQLEDSMRKRAKAERAYQKELEKENATAGQLVATRRRLVKTIQDEIKDQETIIKGAKNKQKELLAEVQNDNELKGLSKYIKVNKLTGQFTLSKDYESVDLDQETREKYDEYIAKFLENEQTIKDAEDAIEDNTDQLKEIDKEGRDANQDIYDRTYEALISERQQEIDKLTTINDSIQEAANTLVSKIQEQIDDARQARQNEKTEEDIADKETRLAYLMMDTSGGNEVEIANLQKEIADSKENYTDSLVDQSLQELSDANAKAAEQRQQQIDIMTAQLEAYSKSSDIWNEVGQLVNESYEAMKEGVAWEDTELGKLLYKAEVKDPNLNPYAIENWKGEIKEVVNEAFAYYVSGKGYKHTPEVDEPSTAPVALAVGYTAINNTNLLVPKVINDTEMNPARGKAPKLIYDVAFSDNTSALVKPKEQGESSNEAHPTLSTLPKQVTFKYKDGGLADFTGPAWLDGTKSKPEMVLNQTDTANFIQLKDILADILHGTSTLEKTDKENKGDNYYDIEINVEKIEDDYDVEQMAEKIKNMIYEDSVYRNVNLVNNIH